MIDVLATMRAYILTKPTVTALVGNRVYAGVSFPPSGYTPGSPVIVFNGRGSALSYNKVLNVESFTFKCYGASDTGAMALYTTLVDAIDDKSGLNIRSIDLDVGGTLLQEQEPLNWWFVLCYFRVQFNALIGV